MIRLSNVGFFICLLISCNAQHLDERIVLVNVGELSRREITHEIDVIGNLNPAVFGIDVQFSHITEYRDDSTLVRALWQCQNLVIPSLIEDYGERGNQEYQEFTYGNLPQFAPEQSKSGFINVIKEDDELGTLKKFSLFELVNGSKEYHFAVQIALVYDSIKATRFILNHDKLIDVNFQNGGRRFKKISAKSVLSGDLTEKDIRGKIVILGFLGPGNEDKFYTPLNKNIKEADMYGVEYLANIVAQVLDY